jgi:hypothetical protein
MSARRFATPRTLWVEADERDRPQAFTWAGRRERVARVEATWATGTGWWVDTTGPVPRRYYRVVTGSGLRAELYRAEPRGDWFLAAIAD